MPEGKHKNFFSTHRPIMKLTRSCSLQFPLILVLGLKIYDSFVWHSWGRQVLLHADITQVAATGCSPQMTALQSASENSWLLYREILNKWELLWIPVSLSTLREALHMPENRDRCLSCIQAAGKLKSLEILEYPADDDIPYLSFKPFVIWKKSNV